MEDITIELKKKFVPKAAIIAYENNFSETYVEMRPINKNGELLAAQTVSKTFINKLVKAFSKKAKEEMQQPPHGIIPRNMLACDPRPGKSIIAWWNPPQKKMLFFTPATQMESRMYNVPGTVFIAQDNLLSVYCYKGKKPTAKTKLLSTPFYNVSPSGSVCLGNAKATLSKTPTWQDVIDYYEKLFWKSEGSHTSGTCLKKGYILTNEIKASKEKPYNTDSLLPIGNTLQGCLNKLIKQ